MLLKSSCRHVTYMLHLSHQISKTIANKYFNSKSWPIAYFSLFVILLMLICFSLLFVLNFSFHSALVSFRAFPIV